MRLTMSSSLSLIEVVPLVSNYQDTKKTKTNYTWKIEFFAERIS